MHILILVYFNAPQGGLHENVRDTVRFLLFNRHRVTVVCKSGQFAQELSSEDVVVVESDFSLISFSKTLEHIENIHLTQPIDLVHAHPFASRQLGILISKVIGLPCIVTMHGKYIDSLPLNIDDIDVVFSVSEGIRQFLIQECGAIAQEKLHVLPNTLDRSLFKPATRVGRNSNYVTIALVTRLDQDKFFVLDLFCRAVEYGAVCYPGQIAWLVVGQGKLQSELARRLESLRGRNEVTFTGWLRGESLRNVYQFSDAVIAPGRCAMEAMSCAVPVIALGSKSYIGLIDYKNWQNAVYSNFGGVGNQLLNYKDGAIESDIDTLMTSEKLRRKLGVFGRRIVQQFFKASDIHCRLLGFYRLVLDAFQAGPRIPTPKSEFLELRLQGVEASKPRPDVLVLELFCERPETLRFAWYLLRYGEVVEKFKYTPDSRREFVLPGPGRYRVRCYVQDQYKRRISFIGAEVNLD